jgi:hypothetical protein
MYRVIVFVGASERAIYEFLEDSRDHARVRAEELAHQGFWLDDVNPRRFVPPSHIQLIKIIQQSRSKQMFSE